MKSYANSYKSVEPPQDAWMYKGMEPLDSAMDSITSLTKDTHGQFVRVRLRDSARYGKVQDSCSEFRQSRMVYHKSKKRVSGTENQSPAPKFITTESTELLDLKKVKSGEQLINNDAKHNRFMADKLFVNFNNEQSMVIKSQNATPDDKSKLMKPIPQFQQFVNLNKNIERKMAKSYCKIHNEAGIQKFL